MLTVADLGEGSVGVLCIRYYVMLSRLGSRNTGQLLNGVLCREPLSLWFVTSVCSSPPIHMKVQPLNQTALQVSWSQPETIYHPPIMNYMISYSWTKNEDEKEKTFTKDSDKELVKSGCLLPLQLGEGLPRVAAPGTEGGLCRCHPNLTLPPALLHCSGSWRDLCPELACALSALTLPS